MYNFSNSIFHSFAFSVNIFFDSEEGTNNFRRYRRQSQKPIDLHNKFVYNNKSTKFILW